MSEREEHEQARAYKREQERQRERHTAHVGAMILLMIGWTLVGVGTDMVFGLGAAFMVLGALLFAVAVMAVLVSTS